MKVTDSVSFELDMGKNPEPFFLISPGRFFAATPAPRPNCPLIFQKLPSGMILPEMRKRLFGIPDPADQSANNVAHAIVEQVWTQEQTRINANPCDQRDRQSIIKLAWKVTYQRHLRQRPRGNRQGFHEIREYRCKT